MIDPEDDSGGDADGGDEGVGTSIVAGVYAPPVLEPSEHVFDLVPLAVEGLIVQDLYLAVGFGRNAGFDLALGQSLPEPVRVIPLVAEQDLGLGEGVDHERGPPIVAHLSFAEQHYEWPPLAVANGMEL